MPEDTIKVSFDQEVQAALEGPLNEMRKIDDSITKKHADLMARWEQGDRPDSEAVVNAEEEKAELQRDVDALRREVRDLTLKNSEVVAQREAKARDAFAGFFFRDADELVNIRRERGAEALNRALTSGTTLSSAGGLNAEQEDMFLDWLVEQQQALSRVNVRRMNASSAYLDELVTGTRKLVAATEGTAPSVADGFSTGRRSLSTVETIWAEDLTYSFIEDNIERGNIESHIARNLATAFGNDHNDLFWNGDEDDSGDFLSINDGIIDIAEADGSVTDYDATSVTAWTTVFNGMLKLLDFKYQALPDHAFFIPFKGIYNYADELADRATSLGDAVLVNGRSALTYFGIPVVGEPHLDAGTSGVLTPLRNLVWGVQRGITFEQERNPRKRAMEYTISARTDQNYSKSEAVVLAGSLESSITD